MNAKTVLNKIMTLLSKEEEMATAKLTDGTIVESPSFDVGQPVEVVTEEGKVPAPDGEHELVLADEEGNEILIKIVTENGEIISRENVELVEEVEEKEEEMEAIIGTEDSDDKDLEEMEEEDPIQKMAIRIEELEKRISQLEGVEVDEERIEEAPDAEVVEVEDEEDFNLPKLDGAPVEKMSRLNIGKAVRTPQSIFLSKLYNK